MRITQAEMGDIPQLLAALLDIWEDSVRATHLFLSDAEIKSIREYVPQALGGVQHLIVAEKEPNKLIAFMGVENSRLEMLFLSPSERGKGIGKELIQYGIYNYEKMSDQVVADEESLETWIFDKQKAEVIFAVEDLYVKPECRGRGYGKAILKKLASIAVERGCGRLEWWCLDWNKPGIDFYLSLGAEPMSDWTVYRITGDTLKQLAGVQMPLQ